MRPSTVVAGLLLAWAACGRTPLGFDGGVSDETDGPADARMDASGGRGGGGGRDGSGGVAGSGGMGGAAGRGGSGGSGGAGGMGGAAGRGGAGGAAGMGGMGGIVGGTLTIAPIGANIPVGASHQYEAYVSRGMLVDVVTAQAVWSVDMTSVATVSNAPGTKGLVTSLGMGATTVRASYGGQVSAAPLQTTTTQIRIVNVTPEVANLTVGGRPQAFRAFATYGTTVTEVTAQAAWRVDDPRVATVTNGPFARGTATAVGAGKTGVYATFAGVTGTAVALVDTPVSLVALSIDPANTTAMLGSTVAFTLNGLFSDMSTRNLTLTGTWMSSNSGIAPLMTNRATCRSPGSVIISASTMGLATSTTLTCATQAVVGLRLVPGDQLMPVPVGTVIAYTLVARLADGSEMVVTQMGTWSTDNMAVATVTNVGQRGVVRAIGPGLATVIASYGGLSTKGVVVVQ